MGGTTTTNPNSMTLITATNTDAGSTLQDGDGTMTLSTNHTTGTTTGTTSINHTTGTTTGTTSTNHTTGTTTGTTSTNHTTGTTITIPNSMTLITATNTDAGST